MAKRTHANDLARLLRTVPQPVYALDEGLTIIFFNQACEEWLGPGSERAIGLRAAYCSALDANSPEGIAAALCPPPEAIVGNPCSAVVTCSFSCDWEAGQGGNAESSTNSPGTPLPLNDGGKTIEKRRRANFIPFGSADNQRGILAILELEDCPVASVESDPLPTEELTREELHAAIRRFRREAAGRYAAEHLIGVSPAMLLARRQVEAAVASGCSVCISGPPGSGRERLAAAIHYSSNPEDAQLPFSQSGMIALDCSVLPPEMIRSTLAALARSSSASDKTDRLKPATLVLNHIDELSDELQAELAVLFSKRPFPRRLISTSALPLFELVQRGKFRADLAALLGTIGIDLPPLTDRREDLPLLAQIFLEECNRQGSKQVGGFTPEAIDKLDAYAWPGNLNELIAVVAAAHRNALGAEIKPDDLPEQIRLAAQAVAHPRKVEEPIQLDEFLRHIERELIRRAIARSKGNKTKAARLLGLTRPRLYRRMVQLGLEES